MQVTINFSVDNAAFHDDDDYDALRFDVIAEAIRDVADRISEGGAIDQIFRVKDKCSGTRVGFAVINEDGVVH